MPFRFFKPNPGLLIAICLVAGAAMSACRQQAAPVNTEPPVQAARDAMPPQADPAWFACKTDADCMPVEGVCSEFSAVNAGFKTEYEKYRDAMRPMVECQALEKPAQPPEVGCIENRCSLKEGQ